MIILAHLLATAAAVYANGLNSRRYLALCAVMPGLVFYEVTMLWFPDSRLIVSGDDDERALSVFMVLVAYAVLFTINLFRDIKRNQERKPDLLKQVLKWGLGLPLLALVATLGLVWQRYATSEEGRFLQWATPSAVEHPLFLFIAPLLDVPLLMPLLALAMMVFWILSLDRIRRFYNGKPVGFMHSLFVIAWALSFFGAGTIGLPVWIDIFSLLIFIFFPAVTFLTTSKSRRVPSGLVPLPLLLTGACTLGIYGFWFWQMLHHQQVVSQSVSVI